MPPKTSQNPQWQVRLDRYHRFVVRRLKKLREADRSVILEQMVVAWVSDHGDQIRQAGASMEDWEKVKDHWADDDD